MPSPLRTLRTYRRLFRNNSIRRLSSELADEQSEIEEAQRLHADVYLRRGYIQAIDTDAGRRMHVAADPYQMHSTYFIVKDGARIIVTARQIEDRHAVGHKAFPTMAKLKLYKQYRQELERVSSTACVEISGLAKASGTDSAAVLLIYKSMWQHSIRHGHRVWLMAIDVRAYDRLRFLFGDALIRIGDNNFYMGSDVVPVMLEVDRSIAPLIRDAKTFNPIKRLMKRRMVSFLLEGLPKKYLHVKKQPVSAFAALGAEGEAA